MLGTAPVRACEATRATASAAGAAQAASDAAGFTPAASLDLEHDGAALHAGAALSVCADIAAALATLPRDRAGVRLAGVPGLAALIAPATAIATARLGAGARPVRAILFDKTAQANWALGWHQDRTIVVADRAEVAGYGPWTRKAGLLHVEPPFALLERMMTIRLHLDDVPADNAPLLIAPGSHRLGRVAEGDVADVVARCGTVACLARAGDIWAYATPILHASARGSGGRRRVVQIDYSADALPPPLAWRGIG